MPLLGEPSHAQMVEQLQALARQMPRPEAIILFSAHWEAPTVRITSAVQPPLIYDYYGFPPAAYQIDYPCKGHSQLAHQLSQQLQSQGIDTALDVQRGFDHGSFVPLKLMYPLADIPCVQVSLLSSLDAQAHIELGKALAGLQWDNLLVIGSGFSFHNMQAFFNPTLDANNSKNRAFDYWLQDTLTASNLAEAERETRLAQWTEAPHARFCHPREEHLLPLQVCYGLMQRACDQSYSVNIAGKQAAMFYWQTP